MNNLIKISTRSDRQKQSEDVVSPESDAVVIQRGASMVSRFGSSTKSQFTCFFRGAKGETGGRGHSENVVSMVKKMKQLTQENISDVINDPVEANDV